MPLKIYSIGTPIEEEWKKSEDPLLRRLVEKKDSLPYSSGFEILREVAKGNTMFVDWISSIVHVELK